MEWNTICLWYDHDEEEAARLCLVPTPTDWSMLKRTGRSFQLSKRPPVVAASSRCAAMIDG